MRLRELRGNLVKSEQLTGDMVSIKLSTKVSLSLSLNIFHPHPCRVWLSVAKCG